MKNFTNKTGSRTARSFSRSRFTIVFVVASFISVNAQDKAPSQPSWWFGGSAAANLNFYDGSTQILNGDKTSAAVFHDGYGVGLYAGPLVEWYRPSSVLGLMMHAGYDNRSGSFEAQLSPCNCPADLTAKLAYISFEPSLRIAPFRNGLFFYVGPRFGYNLENTFSFIQHANPAYPEQADGPEITGDFSSTRQFVVSMQAGAGYDIRLTDTTKRTQVMLAPFVALHPYFGQEPRENESWQLTTARVGLALKFGRTGKKTENSTAAIIEAPAPEILFTVNAPANLPVQRRVRETFPLRNYVYFNAGSTQIPDRYVLLKKEQVKDFKEDQLEVFKPKNLSGRNARQLVAYYNVINIIGDRMGKNPGSTILLVGSSEEGRENGIEMAQSVKKYLVDVFGISPSRIATEGRLRPEQPSGGENPQNELALLSEGNRRVSIESDSPALLMEFQSGKDIPLKPVQIVDVQEAPLDSYVTLEAGGGSDPFTSWNVVTVDKAGARKSFGPFYEKSTAIPGKSIMGTTLEGDYTVILTGITESGKTVTRETSVHMKQWTPPTNEEGMRYSVIFEYNESQSPAMYEKYLTEIVRPKITAGSKVIIHGHTDVIGDAANNQKLAEARAREVYSILQAGVSAAGTKNVKFEVFGFGENEQLAPFNNGYPEERSYNRTVVIDILPAK